jgi:hypothetical protein
MGLTVPWQKAPAGTTTSPEERARETAAVMQAMGAISVEYQATTINDVRYVDEAQAQAIGRESATRGAQIALSAIQNSTGTRKRLGL